MLSSAPVLEERGTLARCGAEVTAPSSVQHLSVGSGGDCCFSILRRRRGGSLVPELRFHAHSHAHRVSARSPGLHVRNGRFVQSQEVGLELFFLRSLCRFVFIYFELFRRKNREQRVISARCTVRAEPLADCHQDNRSCCAFIVFPQPGTTDAVFRELCRQCTGVA